MYYRRVIKYLFNIVIISLWILIFYLQFERPFIARVTQNISPTLLISTLPHFLFWISWISLPLLIFVIIKGRFFCWNICPAGLIQDTIPSLGRAKGSKVNIYIFFGLFIASLFGLNLLAILDPLVTFNRTIISSQIVLFSIPIIIIILLNIYKRRFWCFKICPLGALLDLIRPKYKIEKRKTLIAIGSGLVVGVLLKYKNLWSNPIHDRLLRPPGALPEDEFTDRCIRCGSCIGVCLTKTLTPVFLESGIEGVFTPKLAPQVAECDEYCNKCGTACPTQAIRNLPLHIKRNVKIGTARIDRARCIAWTYNGLCLICQEYCPYLAIEVVKNKNGIPLPQEIPELCRGCGHCEKNCPARPIRAIKVYNIGAGKIIPQKNNLL